MNILEVEDMIKGMPDNALMQEAQSPSGQVPQFLVISELQRRGDMRKRFQAQQQQPQTTVKDQIVMQSMGAAQPQGIMAAQPQQAPQQMPPQQMFSGGIVRLREGGQGLVDGGFLNQQTICGINGTCPSGDGTVKSQIDLAIASGAKMADLFDIFKYQPEVLQYLSSMMPKAEEPAMQYVPRMTETVKPMSLRIAEGLGLFDDAKARSAERRRQREIMGDLPPEPMASAMANQVTDRYMPDMQPALTEVAAIEESRPVGEMFTERAKELAKQLKVTTADAMQMLSQQAKMNMPNYDMLLGPSGGESQIMSGIAGLSDAMSDSYKSEQARINQGIENGSIYAQSTPSSTSSFSLPPIPALIDPQRARAKLSPKIGPMGSIDAETLVDSMTSSRVSEPTNPLAGILDRLSSSYEEEQGRINQGILDGSIYAGQRGQQDQVVDTEITEKTNPQSQAIDTDVTVQGKDGVGSLYEQGFVQAITGTEKSEVLPGYVKDPELSAALALAQQNKDSSAKAETDLQSFLSGLQEKTEKAGLTNALLALGAGVMEGKTGEGVKGAGAALAEAQKQSSAIGMKGKLTQYAAKRADIARGEELASKEKQYDKSLLQTQMNTLLGVIKELQTRRASISAYSSPDDPLLLAIDDQLEKNFSALNDLLLETTPPEKQGWKYLGIRQG